MTWRVCSIPDGEADEIAIALFKLIAAVFEHSYTDIVETIAMPRSIRLLQRLLLLTCFPGYHGVDEQFSEVGLPIWSYLQEEISDNGIVATQSGFGDPRWPVVKDVFGALVDGLLRKIELPPADELRSWPKGKFNFGFQLAPCLFCDMSCCCLSFTAY